MNTMPPTSSQKRFTTPEAGFTLIETLIAIFILALTIGALLSLTAGGFFAIRYAKNDIIASNLLQESLEYVRNTRDSASIAQDTNPTMYNWNEWLLDYSNANCMITNDSDTNACVVNPYATGGDFVGECDSGGCEPLSYYEDVGFYGYENMSRAFDSNSEPITTTFVRRITFRELTNEVGDPEVIVTARIEWKNGTNTKRLSQSIILTSWNLGL